MGAVPRHTVAVGCCLAVLSLGAPPAAAAPTPAADTTTARAATAPLPAAVAAPRPPCPGTTVNVPVPKPTLHPSPSAHKAPTPAPAPTTSLPGPTVPARANVVGGSALGGNGVVVHPHPGTPAPPALNATSWVVADQDTGAIYAAKAPHAQLLPASTLKTLTATVLVPALDPKKVVTATEEDANAEGTRVGMVAGNAYSVQQLFQALLMFSANDAAYALARTYPGGRAATLAAMNAEAQRLGALDTVAKDPSGLDTPGQHSSAYDLALIGREAMRDKEFRSYITTRTATFPGAKMANGTVVPPYQVPNLDHFFLNYPGATGIKTGYTTQAHRTFVGSATRGSRSIVVSYMCSDTVDWEQTGALVDWAFANATKVTPVGRLVDAGTVGPDGAPSTAPTSPSATATAPSASPSAPAAGASAAAAPTPTPVNAEATGQAGSFVERYWGAGVLAVLLAGAGLLVSRRIGAKSRRKA
ncbi:hypothetical protein MM440_16695 [Arsenicicoccus piscis]|uniref:Peptidase S11 D-alanyl-D-alanine carboxypeptidase A N-terminal domain-containing protein n=1 Tax=Arsenicicoccus piscis TaxID=673954 RepID=A0ABQ6HQ00_9MICO|nr:hypothetical protein [Arsenicicoccus piscis]MCH8629362.1 hypothetical protein [Arsenicicoccus piscis]GMA20427.1 hypothetical protein GCM10025862_24480 [Arsenicicoccus piscis]